MSSYVFAALQASDHALQLEIKPGSLLYRKFHTPNHEFTSTTTRPLI
jgi:hypothetical protein